MWAELVRQILYLRPVALLTVAITLIGYAVALLLTRRLCVRGAGTKLAGLFVGMQGKSAWLLGVSWLRFVYLSALLLLAKPLQPVHYFLYFALLLAQMAKPCVTFFLTSLLGGGLLSVGLAVCGALLNYLRQIRYDAGIHATYWLLAALLIGCAAAALLREIPTISGERSYFDEAEETE